jgi:molybdenum cofactor cytidylyltransferase
LSAPHHIAVLLIAAGASRRFGDDDKLMADYHGKPLAAHALETYGRLPVTDKILVLRPQTEVSKLPQTAVFNHVFNEQAARGMGASIAAGMRMVTACDAVCIALADMPAIQPQTVSALLRAAATTDKTIIIPENANGSGHPVIFKQTHFADLRQLNGDIGGRDIIKTNPQDVLRLPVADDGIHIDIDRPDDLRGRHG